MDNKPISWATALQYIAAIVFCLVVGIAAGKAVTRLGADWRREVTSEGSNIAVGGTSLLVGILIEVL